MSGQAAIEIQNVRKAFATALELPALAELFNACFSDYAVPMHMDERVLREHVENNGIDLECSRVVVVKKRPAAFALIARRGAARWVGGMGTVDSHRRSGLGTSALVGGIEAARERGCNAVWLEVIDSNRAAARLRDSVKLERTCLPMFRRRWRMSPVGCSVPFASSPSRPTGEG